MIPEVNHTILDEYYSYDYDVPGVSQTFIFAGSNKLHKARHRHFTTLGLMLYKSNYELVALYTSLIDHLAHIYLDENIIKLKPLYVDIFNYSQNLIKKGLDVMIISDHGCVNGNHTHEAYAGSNHPIEAKNVCELYLEMTSRLVK